MCIIKLLYVQAYTEKDNYMTNHIYLCGTQNAMIVTALTTCAPKPTASFQLPRSRCGTGMSYCSQVAAVPVPCSPGGRLQPLNQLKVESDNVRAVNQRRWRDVQPEASHDRHSVVSNRENMMSWGGGKATD